jgi:flavin-dependent dehydrogenase
MTPSIVKRDEYDVIILGSGPAGATSALELVRLGYSVVIIQDTPDNNWKIGECLPPVAKRLLVSLNLWDSFLKDQHRACYGICSSWGSTDLYHQSFIFDPYGNGWHLDRRRFDEMLLSSAVAAGAVSQNGSAVSCARNTSNGWQIDVQSSDGQRSKLRAKFAVDATGRRCWLARRQRTGRVSYDRLTSVVGLIETAATTDLDYLITIEAIEQGWWYSARLPDGRLVAALMVDSDLQTIRTSQVQDYWLSQLRRTIHIGQIVESNNYEVVSVSAIVAANSSCLSDLSGRSWLAVGDAAAAYDPLSSQGILSAMEMARAASAAIHRYLKGEVHALEAYSATVKRGFAGYLASLRLYYEMEQRWPQAPFWKRRISASHMPGAASGL